MVAKEITADGRVIENCREIGPTSECKVYKMRWLILFLYFMYTITSLIQLVQYSIIADIVARYYDISYMAVDWTCMVFNVLYIPFGFPGSYLLEKLGLRQSTLIAMAGTCLGTWIKVASVAPNRFWVLLLGQSIVSIFEVLILPVPPVLASVWFGPNEVSSACGIALIGMQIGVALGFVIPPFIVNGHDNADTVAFNLYILALGIAVISTVMLPILFLFFKDEPPLPPSLAQLKIREKKKENINFMKSVKELMCNSSFVLLLITYNVNVGVSNVFSTLLNHIILKYYPEGLEDAGGIGLATLVAGIFGCLICGVLLDKYGKFEQMTLILYGVNLLAMVGLTFSLGKHISLVYIVSIVQGFTWTSIGSTGFELAAELTHPISTNISAGLLTVGCQVTTITFTYLYSILFDNVGDAWANISMVALLIFGFILTVCIRYDLKRRATQITVDPEKNCNVDHGVLSSTSSSRSTFTTLSISDTSHQIVVKKQPGPSGAAVRGTEEFITPRLHAALDRCKINDRRY